MPVTIPPHNQVATSIMFADISKYLLGGKIPLVENHHSRVITTLDASLKSLKPSPGKIYRGDRVENPIKPYSVHIKLEELDKQLGISTDPH